MENGEGLMKRETETPCVCIKIVCLMVNQELGMPMVKCFSSKNLKMVKR